MGKRTSVYLSDELYELVEASKYSLGELVWHGLQSVSPSTPSEERRARGTGDCPHPKRRRSKGGLCMACGINVGTAP